MCNVCGIATERVDVPSVENNLSSTLYTAKVLTVAPKHISKSIHCRRYLVLVTIE
jgi:hypothetical protein